MLKRILLVVFMLIVAAGCYVLAGLNDSLGRLESPGVVAASPRPLHSVTERTSNQEVAAREIGTEEPKQILFGDLHVPGPPRSS